jgi:hypothetical protein
VAQRGEAVANGPATEVEQGERARSWRAGRGPSRSTRQLGAQDPAAAKAAREIRGLHGVGGAVELVDRANHFLEPRLGALDELGDRPVLGVQAAQQLGVPFLGAGLSLLRCDRSAWPGAPR